MPLNLSPYFAPASPTQGQYGVGNGLGRRSHGRAANLAHRQACGTGAAEMDAGPVECPQISRIGVHPRGQCAPPVRSPRATMEYTCIVYCHVSLPLHSLLRGWRSAPAPRSVAASASPRHCSRLASLGARAGARTTPSSESRSRPAPSPPRRSSAARRTASRCSAASGWRGARCCGQLVAPVTPAGSAPVPMVTRPALLLGLPVHRSRGHWSAVLLPLGLGARSAPVA